VFVSIIRVNGLSFCLQSGNRKILLQSVKLSAKAGKPETRDDPSQDCLLDRPARSAGFELFAIDCTRRESVVDIAEKFHEVTPGEYVVLVRIKDAKY